MRAQTAQKLESNAVLVVISPSTAERFVHTEIMFVKPWHCWLKVPNLTTRGMNIFDGSNLVCLLQIFHTQACALADWIVHKRMCRGKASERRLRKEKPSEVDWDWLTWDWRGNNKTWKLKMISSRPCLIFDILMEIVIHNVNLKWADLCQRLFDIGMIYI